MSTLKDWDQDPITCFAAFVQSQEFPATSHRRADDVDPPPVSAQSATVYRAMFGKFAHWMSDEGKSMSTVDHGDLKRFIERSHNGKRDLNSKIAYRYLRLLERCFEYLQREPNPGRQAILAFDRSKLARDAPMAALTPQELESFLRALPAGCPVAPFPATGWKRRRDRAMQIVMVFAGLKVAEVVGLLLHEIGRQVRVDGSIELAITPARKHPTSYAHNTVLPASALVELRAWLSEREALGFGGELVFPADQGGGELDKATVYRQVRATFERAGLAPLRSGGRTLRNTFAVSQLREGTAATELTSYLGLALERSTEVYRNTSLNTGEVALDPRTDDDAGLNDAMADPG